jgi:hypothetical protein
MTRSSDGQTRLFPGGLTRVAANLELATIHRSRPVDCTTAGPADSAAQSDAAGMAGAFSIAGSQIRTTAGPDDGQAQTPHLFRLVLGKVNVAGSGVKLLVGTTSAALLAVINRPFPHGTSLLAPRLLRSISARHTTGRLKEGPRNSCLTTRFPESMKPGGREKNCPCHS